MKPHNIVGFFYLGWLLMLIFENNLIICSFNSMRSKLNLVRDCSKIMVRIFVVIIRSVLVFENRRFSGSGQVFKG